MGIGKRRGKGALAEWAAIDIFFEKTYSGIPGMMKA